MAPPRTQITTFLDIALASQTTHDPAPFCWPEWQENISVEVVPWSPLATSVNTTLEVGDIAAIRAFTEAYFALDVGERERFIRNTHNHAQGKKAMRDYIAQRWPIWGLNNIVDELLKENDVSEQDFALEDLSGIIPMDQTCIPGLIPDLAQQLFGSKAIRKGASLQPWAVRFARSILQNSYNRYRMAIVREGKRLKDDEANLTKARRVFETKEADNAVTKASIQPYLKALGAVAKRLTRWKNLLEDRFEEVSAELNRVHTVMVSQQDTAETIRLPPGLRRALRTMPNEHDQEEALAQVVEYIRSSSTEDRDFDLVDISAAALADWKEGVEAYKELTTEQIQQMLGLPSPTFPFFNQKQDPSGIHLPWSAEGRAALGSEEATDLTPFWHQWVGVLKIIDNMMARKNVLLMDQVGVGKTMQAIGAIATYEWLRLTYNQKGRYPDRFAKTARGQEALPDADHIIICPPNLVEQWTVEIQRYLAWGTFAILPYQGSCTKANRLAFQQASQQAKGTRIILATYNAMKSDAEFFFNLPLRISPANAGDRLPVDRSADPEVAAATLFAPGKQYGIVIMDEAHYARTARATRLAAVELVTLATAVVAMTATPIMTSPMDVVLLAQMLHIPGFKTEAMQEHRKAYMRAKKHDTKQRKARSDTVQLAAAVAIGKRTVKSEESETKIAIRAWVSDVRTLLIDYVIRRSVHSTDRDGRSIIRLPPWRDIIVPVTLREDELMVQHHLADRLREERSKLTTTGLEAFYLGIRKALLHKSLADLEDHRFPSDKDGRPYTDFPSSKLDALLALLEYHIGGSCAPPALVDPTIAAPESDPEGWSRIDGAPVDKIVVYLAFPSSNWLVRKALEHAGIKFLEINSEKTPKQRADTLNSFRLSSEVQVVLMSNVGTVGLNIAFANIVVIVDNLWSAQEMEQLIGRVWRHPQSKQVLIYSLIAVGTSDVFLNTISRDKGTMQSGFMNTDTALKRALEDGDSEFIEEETEESEAEEVQAKEVKKASKGKQKATTHDNKPSKATENNVKGTTKKPINPWGQKSKSTAGSKGRKSILTGVRPPRREPTPVNPAEEALSAQRFQQALEQMELEERAAPSTPLEPDFDSSERLSLPPSPSLPSVQTPFEPPEPDVIPPPLPPPSVPSTVAPNPTSAEPAALNSSAIIPNTTPSQYADKSSMNSASNSAEVDESTSTPRSKRAFSDTSSLSDVPPDVSSIGSDNETPVLKKPRTDSDKAGTSRQKSPRKAVDQAGALGLRNASRHSGLSSLPPPGGSSKHQDTRSSSTSGPASKSAACDTPKAPKKPNKPRARTRRTSPRDAVWASALVSARAPRAQPLGRPCALTANSSPPDAVCASALVSAPLRETLSAPLRWSLRLSARRCLGLCAGLCASPPDAVCASALVSAPLCETLSGPLRWSLRVRPVPEALVSARTLRAQPLGRPCALTAHSSPRDAVWASALVSAPLRETLSAPLRWSLRVRPVPEALVSAPLRETLSAPLRWSLRVRPVRNLSGVPVR
ncbi:hypothetical protein ACG7TL_005167 [Trametes sanguinea]